MGMRLPLASLPWVAPDKRDPQEPQSLFEDLPELKDYHGEVARRYSHIEAKANEHPDFIEQDLGDSEPTIQVEVPHTALCVEAREGRLYIFMPPLTLLEHYLELVAAIETTAENLGMPVVLEGYEPPRDYRVERLMVTPDPGVIEVNIHPSKSWQELVDKTTILYEEARQSRLGTEKFMQDGPSYRHRWRQPYYDGCGNPRRQPLATSTRFITQPDYLLATSSRLVIFIFRHVYRANQPSAACR